MKLRNPDATRAEMKQAYFYAIRELAPNVFEELKQLAPSWNAVMAGRTEIYFDPLTSWIIGEENSDTIGGYKVQAAEDILSLLKPAVRQEAHKFRSLFAAFTRRVSRFKMVGHGLREMYSNSPKDDATTKERRRLVFWRT